MQCQADIVHNGCLGIWGSLFYLMAPCDSQRHMNAKGQAIGKNLTVLSDIVLGWRLAVDLAEAYGICISKSRGIAWHASQFSCCSNVVAAEAGCMHYPNESRHSTRAS